ncbi:hypothetical protein ES702_03069 [subsurface metagenome]
MYMSTLLSLFVSIGRLFGLLMLGGMNCTTEPLGSMTDVHVSAQNLLVD